MKSEGALERARRLLEERRAELQVELEHIEHALNGLQAAGPKPRAQGAATAAPRRRRRRGGTRAEHALTHIGKNPGATASEIAGALGIKPNYVYRVMGELEKDGLARKEGRGYHAVGAP